MFGFKLWSGFGAFRDPLTITQNLTFSIPPKTTIGGMLAAVLGMDYQDYFDDPEFFDFGYSLILLNPVQKKSFAQNYIEDYTKKSATRLDAMLKVRSSEKKLSDYEKQKREIEAKEAIGEKEQKEILILDKKINSSQKALIKARNDWMRKSSERYTKSKPIFRELLINPAFLVFIHEFKFETDIVKRMKNHESAYPLYMGNSEFAANYRFVECVSWRSKEVTELSSFTGFTDKITFEPNKKYTSVYAATRTVGHREYRDFKHVVVCDKPIRLSAAIAGYEISTELGRHGCDFI
ncbi:MAG: CRISPR-associated protein Cas5 [Thermodesulfobacteriota bacterium]|nr:CRISPR-associated protein Cas5 [Thermodesulfobacteriota bacterium]